MSTQIRTDFYRRRVMPHVDQWTLAEPGECEYCGAHVMVYPEPFGHKQACRQCWEAICHGEDE